MYVAPADYAVRLVSVALYAAYGSNMDPAQMLLRCPHSPQRGTGWLEGWRLTFGGEDLGWDGALTTLVEDPAQRDDHDRPAAGPEQHGPAVGQPGGVDVARGRGLACGSGGRVARGGRNYSGRAAQTGSEG